jgi:hypothetical protein
VHIPGLLGVAGLDVLPRRRCEYSNARVIRWMASSVAITASLCSCNTSRHEILRQLRHYRHIPGQQRTMPSTCAATLWYFASR